MIRITNRKLLPLLAVPIFAVGIEKDMAIPHKTIITLGANSISQASYYNHCGQKNIIQINDNAGRWSRYNGTHYLGMAFKDLTKLSDFEKQWAEKGWNGILIYDPMKSIETKHVGFNKQTCEYIKTIVESKFKNMESYVYKK